jgi:uncharacterized pyridoxamine 5'-phosphate oxidase family protein
MDFSACDEVCDRESVTSIATSEGDQPRVRAFAMRFADFTGFSSHTGTPKKIFGRLKKNPKVESASINPVRAPGP